MSEKKNCVYKINRRRRDHVQILLMEESSLVLIAELENFGNSIPSDYFSADKNWQQQQKKSLTKMFAQLYRTKFAYPKKD